MQLGVEDSLPLLLSHTPDRPWWGWKDVHEKRRKEEDKLSKRKEKTAGEKHQREHTGLSVGEKTER